MEGWCLARGRATGPARPARPGRCLQGPERTALVRIGVVVGHVGLTLLFDEHPFADEQLHQSGDDFVQHRLQRLVGRRGHFDEDRFAFGVAPVHAVQHRAVKVDVQIGRRSKSLDQRDRAAVSLLGRHPGLIEQKARDGAVYDLQHRRHQLGLRGQQQAQRNRQRQADIYFWDESGLRADTVHGKTWAAKGKTAVIARPGQRQSISAASAVNAKGGFWFATYQGALNAELFIELLKRMMKGRKNPVHLVVDGLPAHKKLNVRQYIESTNGKLTMHVLPGYAPDLNPDELVWSYVKRTGVARNPLRAGEKLEIRIDGQLREMQNDRRLVRSFFGAPSVAYISDC